jgi:phage host-nuclease inhibitor protein Gam
MAKVLKENTELTNQINELKIQYNEQLENFKKEITDIQEENKKNL